MGGRCGGVGAYSRLGAYSRWALIRGWALIRINAVLNFHISRKRISVKLSQPYVTFNQPLSQVRKSLPTSAYLGNFA